MCISACPFSQNLETIKNAETFKGDDELIKKALMEYKRNSDKEYSFQEIQRGLDSEER